MRAGLLLEALARNFRVDLWWIPISGDTANTDLAAAIERQIKAELEVDRGWQLAHRSGETALRRLGRPSACRFAVHRAHVDLRDALGLPDYGCTVVLRSYLLPFAIPLGRAGGELGHRVLDLDDDEASTHRRLSELPDVEGFESHHRAVAHRLEAELYDTFEARAVPWSERLLSAQRAHAERLQKRFPRCRVEVLANAVVVPERLDKEIGPPSASPKLVFVGNLSYEPNVLAARELALQILPALEGRGYQPQLRLVGRRPAPAVSVLARRPAVSVVADAPTLDEHYAWADLAVLPLRAGGGTRIKVLESFAAGVPVVATPLGAEGLDVTDGQQLLLRASMEELVIGVEQLSSSPEKAWALAQRAHAWVRRHHERRQVIERLAESLFAPLAVESMDPSRSAPSA
ncbi:MAG: glycosyltransferase family 4 protein [Holophagales bacterium]|nr:glycosyltransferase family 4 protein [Holophagales bacterium]